MALPMRSVLIGLLIGGTVFSGLADAIGINCYERVMSNDNSNGTEKTCPSDSSCFSYTNDQLYNYAGCGDCTSALVDLFNCSSCSNDYCNTQPVVSCLALSGANSISDGMPVSCYGSWSCYIYSYGAAYFGGCGTCKLYSASNPGCASCSDDYCNNATTSSGGTDGGGGGLPMSASLLQVDSQLVASGAMLLAVLLELP